MAGVVDGVIDSQTLVVFETLLADAAKFQTMTSPSSEKKKQISIFLIVTSSQCENTYQSPKQSCHHSTATR